MTKERLHQARSLPSLTPRVQETLREDAQAMETDGCDPTPSRMDRPREVDSALRLMFLLTLRRVAVE
jgi:hypothetical protein